MKILAIETTANLLGACLWEDFRMKGVKIKKDSKSHSNHLMPLLHDLFKKVKWKPADIDALAVDVGPGRFTGLRVGVSAVRTLGHTLEKPIVEVSSLETIAAQGSGWLAGKPFVWKFPQDLLCVLTDALRDEVYMAVWRFHKVTERNKKRVAPGRSFHTFGHHFKLVHSPALFPFKRFLEFFQSCFQAQSLLFVGSAADRYRPELKKAFGSRARFINNVKDPDPHWVAALGSEKFFRRDIKSFNQVKPLYLRPSYAEQNAAKSRK